MFCESYRRPLTEAACGAALTAALERHLEGCAACRSAFAAELALARSIDRELGAAVNVPVPPSLAPRVRAAVSAEGRRPMGRLATAALVGALAAVGLIVGMPHVDWTPRVAPAGKPPASASEAGVPPDHGSAAPPAAARRLVRAPLPARMPARSQPEVLVAPEEQAGFDRYLAQLRAHPRGRSSARLEGDAGREFKPLEIAAMDFRELTIQPLDSGDAR